MTKACLLPWPAAPTALGHSRKANAVEIYRKSLSTASKNHRLETGDQARD